MLCSVKCAGTTHDSIAFYVSSYAERLRKGDISEGYWITADDAYICNESIITPLPSSWSVPGSTGDAFNYYLSKHRLYIEHAFGTMAARWSIWRRQLRFTLSQNALVVQLAMSLLNFCVENAENEVSVMMSHEEFEEICQYAEALTLGPSLSRSSSTLKCTSKRRDNLLQVMKEKGLQRPNIA